MSFSIVDKDNGYKAKLQQVRELRTAVVKVGVPDTPREEDGTAMDVVGAVHEFGNAHTPQRSFLRAWADEHQAEADAKLQAQCKAYLETEGAEDPTPFLTEFGQWVVAGVKDRIRSNIAPPLNPQTVKRKGHDLALVDTEQLVGSLTQEVVIGGKTQEPAHVEPEPIPETESTGAETVNGNADTIMAEAVE